MKNCHWELLVVKPSGSRSNSWNSLERPSLCEKIVSNYLSMKGGGILHPLTYCVSELRERY